MAMDNKEHEMQPETVSPETEHMEEITLQNDTGANIVFLGQLSAEHSFFDEVRGALTQQKLYVTHEGHQAYSVVTSDGKNKERRAYLIKRQGRLCRINNGLFGRDRQRLGPAPGRQGPVRPARRPGQRGVLYQGHGLRRGRESVTTSIRHPPPCSLGGSLPDSPSPFLAPQGAGFGEPFQPFGGPDHHVRMALA